jgi:hypothetical protein
MVRSMGQVVHQAGLVHWMKLILFLGLLWPHREPLEFESPCQSSGLWPHIVGADAQARQLQMISLWAATRTHLAECVLFADDRPLPDRTRPAASSEFDDLVAEALAAGKRSG